jgi:hypothetical protein
LKSTTATSLHAIPLGHPLRLIRAQTVVQNLSAVGYYAAWAMEKSVQRAWHAARPHVNGVPLGRGEKAAIANKKNPGRERPGLSLPVAERGLLHGCGGF